MGSSEALDLGNQAQLRVGVAAKLKAEGAEVISAFGKVKFSLSQPASLLGFQNAGSQLKIPHIHQAETKRIPFRGDRQTQEKRCTEGGVWAAPQQARPVPDQHSGAELTGRRTSSGAERLTEVGGSISGALGFEQSPCRGGRAKSKPRRRELGGNGQCEDRKRPDVL